MYKLLILDDEPLVRKGIKAFVDFDSLDITDVYEASNGEQGLALFKEHQPEIVLADINMPKMDGLAFAKEAKSINKRSKIAMITGYDYFDYAITALKIGVDDFILKPVSKEDIHEVLMKLIQRFEEEANQQEVVKVTTDIKNDLHINENKSDQTFIQEIVAKHFCDSEFSLGFLADKMGVSKGYLSVLFKKSFGITFQEHILKIRLDHAKLLLLTTEFKNYEIAEHIGFDDANYFSTRFKKQFGCSPKQYKEKARNYHDE